VALQLQGSLLQLQLQLLPPERHQQLHRRFLLPLQAVLQRLLQLPRPHLRPSPLQQDQPQQQHRLRRLLLQVVHQLQQLLPLQQHQLPLLAVQLQLE